MASKEAGYREQLKRLDVLFIEMGKCRKRLEAAADVQAEIDNFIAVVRKARRITIGNFPDLDRLLDQTINELWRLERVYGMRKE